MGTERRAVPLRVHGSSQSREVPVRWIPNISDRKEVLGIVVANAQPPAQVGVRVAALHHRGDPFVFNSAPPRRECPPRHHYLGRRLFAPACHVPVERLYSENGHLLNLPPINRWIAIFYSAAVSVIFF